MFFASLHELTHSIQDIGGVPRPVMVRIWEQGLFRNLKSLMRGLAGRTKHDVDRICRGNGRITYRELRELSRLSSRAAAAEIERRGLGKVSYRTVMRARARLGLGNAS